MGSFSLTTGAIAITTPAVFSGRFPGMKPPVLPWVGAVEFAVSDVGETHRFLHEGQFDVHQSQDGS
ncbi:MAG: hypothetical protein ACC642_10990, partial [Pseudomonadales bacterium]